MPKLRRAAPEIPAADMEKALAYYTSKLGFRIVMTMPGADYAIVERDDVALHLFSDRANSRSPVSVHIFIEDLETLFQEVQTAGANILQGIVPQPWGTLDFRVTDPDGNMLKFTEPRADDE